VWTAARGRGRRVAELWRTAGTGVEAITSEWATLYQELTREVARLAAAPPADGVILQGELRRVLAEQRSRQPRSRADRIRDRLIEGVRPVRSLLRALVTLPWAGTDGHPVLAALHVLRVGYDADDMTLASTVALSLGVTVDTALHLTPLGPEPEDPAAAKLRAVLDRRIGEAQLPELMLAVDAEVRYSWLMLGREPRSTAELVMVYAGILAHGTVLSAAETARMIPQLSAAAIRQAMRFAADERRLAAASRAVLEYMHRHPIAAAWGRSDLASSAMMSLETSRRVWQARIDPRRQTPSVGIYTHVRDRWGISYVQPIVLNERQAGAAIEGVVRDEALATTQLATDTHGHTDVAMALSDRHLFLPKGSEVPEVVRAIVRTRIDPTKIAAQWDRIVQLGQLLRTVFLADYFVNDAFRRELLRVLNRGESVNALKRAIDTGRVASFQAKRHDELAAATRSGCSRTSSWPGTPRRCRWRSIG